MMGENRERNREENKIEEERKRERNREGVRVRDLTPFKCQRRIKNYFIS